MKKTVLTFGLIAGGILSLMMVANMSLIDRIGFDRGEILGYTTMVLAFLMIFFGIKSYRDNVLNGSIGFAEAFAVGLLITLVSCAFYIVTWEILYFNVFKDFGDKYGQYMIERARTQGASAEAIQAQAQQMKEFKALYDNPLINAAITFIEPFPIGLLVTTISAFVLRRKSPARMAVATV